MGRSGYVDGDVEETWDWIRWRGSVASAIRGKRGQAFLKELVKTLDAMPEKRLIKDALKDECGEVCAVGAVMEARKLPFDVDVNDYDSIASIIEVNAKLIQELECENDQAVRYITLPWTGTYSCNGSHVDDSPEARWAQVRAWAEAQLKKDVATQQNM
jgi:hypothetical protein